MKLTKRHTIALRYLSRHDHYVAQRSIPDGNGHITGYGASHETMTELKRAGFVEYGRNPNQSYSGYRVTEAGRAALSGAMP